jgi:hypothetical protein
MSGEGDLVRNTAVGFAKRTMVNVDAMMGLHRTGTSIHPVTHLTNSLLGLVVFLHERRMESKVASLADVLLSEVWPEWKGNIVPGHADDLKAEPSVLEFIARVRHAVAHGKVTFDSDLSDPDRVMVTFDSSAPVRKKKQAPEWRTVWTITIRARHLEGVCRGICERL